MNGAKQGKRPRGIGLEKKTDHDQYHCQWQLEQVPLDLGCDLVVRKIQFLHTDN
jgi:hypothetical protein